MPLGVGGSVELRSGNRWKIAITGQYRKWSQYKGFGTGNQDSLNDSYSFGIGGQWTPPKRQVGNNAFTTSNYRLGFKYSQTPYIVNNLPVNDMKFTLGMGIPIAQRDLRFLNRDAQNIPANWPYVDVALELGQTGNFTTNKVVQQYFMLSLGFHIFEVNWFMKHKLE